MDNPEEGGGDSAAPQHQVFWVSNSASSILYLCRVGFSRGFSRSGRDPSRASRSSSSAVDPPDS